MSVVRSTPLRPVQSLGRWGVESLEAMGRFALFLGEAVVWTFIPPLKVSQFYRRVHFIGVRSLSVILLTGAFTGMVLGLQTFVTLSRFGSEALLGPAVALSLIREMGPVFTALMVTGRTGSALTAEIAIMRITEQIDAIQVMGLNPMRYLIVPILLAGVATFPLLTAIFDVVGIFGGYLVGVQIMGLSSGTYFGEMRTFVSLHDITTGLWKSFAFGVVVTWVCSYKGYYTAQGTVGVSRATTEAVVLSSVLILVWDYFMGSVLP